MARVARSPTPLYQTRGRPILWPIRMTNPDGSAMDLTGAAAHVVLRSAAGSDEPLAVAPIGPDGVVAASGTAVQSRGISVGAPNSLHLTLTDSGGGITDYVWPVIGEDP